MKILRSLMLICLISTEILVAQNHWCATDEYNEQLIRKASPELQKQILQQRDGLFSLAQEGRAESGTVYTIPVVVHVIHYNCVGNISKAQIEDGIRVLNEDFRRMNSDTSVTRPMFKPFAADIEIEFKLAKIDPNGKCTEGIVRMSNSLSYDSRDEVKALSYWPSNKYMNIWIVNSIESFSGTGTTLGYAQFPGGGNWSTYGIVVRNSAWGTIGTANSDGRTASHEIGHALGLFHTFQGGCGNSCGNSGDRICDTPPTEEATWGCVTTQNTCSNDQNGSNSPFTSNEVDQIENFMSYDACTNMFSQDQSDVMRSSLTFFSTLANLVSNNNLIATGTNASFVAGTCAPQADFCKTESILCENQTLTFTDNSYNGPASTRIWSFPGGSPSTSPDSVVTVTYSSAGNYDVTLTVSNGAGSTLKKVTNLVTVAPSVAQFTHWHFSETFENEMDFAAYWKTESIQGVHWEITTDAAYTGERSIFLNNYITAVNGWTDAFISPSYDLSAVTQPKLTFKVAFAKKSSANSDLLRIYYSTNCGAGWNIMNGFSATAISSAEDVFGEFVPADQSQWKEMTASIPVFVLTNKNVYFKFEFVSGGGNNIFIDDINIQSATGVDGSEAGRMIRVFPNPASDVLYIKADGMDQDKVIQLTDLSGKVVSRALFDAKSGLTRMDVAYLPEGLYFVKAEGTAIVTKVVIR